MTIGIDARFWGTGTGIGRYTEELVRGLEALDGQTSYKIFLRRENWDNYKPRAANFEKKLLDARWYTFKEQLSAARVFNRAGVDLLHLPHWNVPLALRAPFVVTIHDLILLHQFKPRSWRLSLRATKLDPFRFLIKYLGYRLVLGHALRRAKAVLTVSNWTAQKLAEEMNVAPRRLTVTYEAATDWPEAAETEDKKIRDSLGLKKSYILNVGNFYPHKNLETLCRAYKILASSLPEEKKPLLVFAGGRDVFAERLIKKIVKAGLKLGQDVIFTGRLDDRKLSAVFRGALVYASPSLEEGFGLTGLEAMKAGVPVAAARAGALPEIYGEAALFFNPVSPEQLAAALKKLISDQALKERLRLAGKERVKLFSWKRLAEQTLAVYRRALKPTGKP